MTTPEQRSDGDQPVVSSPISGSGQPAQTPTQGGLTEDTESKRRHELDIAKLNRRGSIAVGIIAALVTVLATVPASIWIANKQIDAANEKSQNEFLRTQRIAAYGKLMENINAVHRAISDCQVAFQSFDPASPPDEHALATAAGATGTLSALGEGEALIVTSGNTQSVILRISDIRYNAVQHCFNAVDETDPAEYNNHASTLQQDVDAINQARIDFIDSAREDVSSG